MDPGRLIGRLLKPSEKKKMGCLREKGSRDDQGNADSPQREGQQLALRKGALRVNLTKEKTPRRRDNPSLEDGPGRKGRMR